MVIPILEEIIVVTKRLVLKEELHIRRVTEAHEVTQRLCLRRRW
jgi:stress response protein YsnF